jgi:hypothetical protein
MPSDRPHRQAQTPAENGNLKRVAQRNGVVRSTRGVRPPQVLCQAPVVTESPPFKVMRTDGINTEQDSEDRSPAPPQPNFESDALSSQETPQEMRSCDLTPPAADAEPEREDPSKAADVETNLSKQAEEARTASAAIDAEEKRKAAEEARRKAADVETNLSKQAEEARTASAAIDAEEKRKAAEEARRASAAIDAEEKRKAAESEARKAEEARKAAAEALDDAYGDDSLVNEFMIMEEQQNTPGSVTETPKTSAMEQTPTRTTALTPDQKQAMKIKRENALLRKEVRS